MNLTINRFRDSLDNLAKAIVVAEKTLASMPGSRLDSCTYELDEHASYFRDDPSDSVRLRFGQMKDHPGECVYIELSNESNEVYYTLWIGDEIIPVPIRVAVARQIPALLKLAATDADKAGTERAEKITIAIEHVTAAISESDHGFEGKWC